MAESFVDQEECYSIKLTDLKAKYLRAGGMKKIRDFCNRGIRKEAGEIEVNPFKEREFMKFKVRGSGDFLSALRLIQGEFIRRDHSIAGNQTTQPERLPRATEPGHSAPRKAAEELPQPQIEEMKGTNPEKHHLLTVEALRKHNLYTGACELRQFACEPCDRPWWRVVFTNKPVSRCNRCHERYDALPRDMEFGIGWFTCDCGNRFRSRCTATTECTCHNCHQLVSKPYIHPKNKTTSSHTPRHRHTCADCKGSGNCPNFRRVVNPSAVHDSSGSTCSTFLSQISFGSGSDSCPWFYFKGGKLIMDSSDEVSSSGDRDTDSNCFKGVKLIMTSSDEVNSSGDSASERDTDAGASHLRSQASSDDEFY